jgi:MerR family transcriptional regulator, redox-sensitive transcriptional activator SoxR
MTQIWLSIGEVADRTGLAPSAIRFYEDRGLIVSERTAGGTRRFRRDMLRRLAVVQAAQRVGLSLDEIRASLDELGVEEAPDPEQWARLSASWKPMLQERIRVLEALSDQLDACIGCGCLSLERCALRNPDDEAGRAGPGAHYLTDPR